MISAPAQPSIDDDTPTTGFDLFDTPLPGVPSLHGRPLLRTVQLLDHGQAERVYRQLRESLEWNDGSYVAEGRRFQLPRLQAWYADDRVDYRYAEQLHNSHRWTPELLDLRRRVEAVVHQPFNAVLANCYRTGQDSVDWHADDDADLGPEPVIASLSLGTTRTFLVRPRWPMQNRIRAAFQIALSAGMLLVMDPLMQTYFEHAVLAESEADGGRINLTFRHVVGD